MPGKSNFVFVSKEKQAEDAQEQENLGVPTIKYGDTIVFIRHVDSDLWISYETLELTIKGIGKVEEKRVRIKDKRSDISERENHVFLLQHSIR